MTSCEAALERLCLPEHEVSAHYLISRYGEVFGLVDEQRRAWHAGAGFWGSDGDVNSRSIGIELDNDGTTPFTAVQMDRLEVLLRVVMERWNIPPAGIIGHSDMAPMRKSDPGRRFDWRRLALSRLAVWPDKGAGTAPDVDDFLKAAQHFGYWAEYGFEAVHLAFRQRFRPQAEGPLDGVDMAMIYSLTLDQGRACT
ncbi:MAG: N-acetylmuramoyl-L-alanine amidase [Rhodobacteraceae bacterium]|nr:N-acetylmuramoyl-L-alanine amidase [Paracoccaceae bacterium]